MDRLPCARGATAKAAPRPSGLRDVVTSPERRRSLEASGRWDASTLAARVEAFAATQPDQLAVVDHVGARRRTYAQLNRDSDRVAAYLRGLGIGADDVVSVQLPNWYETVAVDLGVLKVGAVLNPLLTVYRAHELDAILSAAKSRALFTPASYRRFDYRAMAGALRARGHSFEHTAFADVDAAPDAFETWLAALPAAERRTASSAADVSELIFSSGTEARPKAIMHTEQTTNAAMRSAADALDIGPEDVVWMPSPIGHSTGFNYGVRMALYHGATLVLQDQWDAAIAIDLVAEWRCTYTVGATTFISDIIECAGTSGTDLSSLRLFSSGGAPVPPSVVHSAAELGVSVLRLYGSTEVLVASWNRPDSPTDKLLNTDGAPLPGVELETRSETGNAVQGEPGELFVRSPSVSVGFFDDPQRTAATFLEDGWLRTGDVGAIDDDGYFTMVGRKKEILIRGGLNVAPREVEELIATMPAVRAIAVVPLPDSRLGEIGCACVVPSGAGAPTLEQVKSHLRDLGLASYKLPERLEIFSELPRTSTGKLQKFEIVQQVLARAVAADPR